MRILCLDIGDKRIGVAVSDPFGWTAQGLTTILRTTKRRDFEEIFKYIEKTEAQRIIIGIPLNSEGGIGVMAEKVLSLIGEFRVFLKGKGCKVPLETWDESYSTSDAEGYLINEAGLGRKKRRRVIDKMAAVMILKSYLEGGNIWISKKASK